MTSGDLQSQWRSFGCSRSPFHEQTDQYWTNQQWKDPNTLPAASHKEPLTSGCFVDATVWLSQIIFRMLCYIHRPNLFIMWLRKKIKMMWGQGITVVLPKDFFFFLTCRTPSWITCKSQQMMYLSADELFTPPGLSNLGGKCLSSAKSSRDTAVNKKAMQEQGRRDECADGESTSFSSCRTLHWVSLKKATWLPAWNERLDRGPCGSGGQSAAEVNW